MSMNTNYVRKLVYKANINEMVVRNFYAVSNRFNVNKTPTLVITFSPEDDNNNM
jgi:hypothetical protein